MVVSRLAEPLPRRTTWLVATAGWLKAVPAPAVATSSASLTLTTSAPEKVTRVVAVRVALPRTAGEPPIVVYVWVLVTSSPFAG